MIALDDAAWGSPWRQRAVGEKLLLSMGLLATAVTAPPWPVAAPLVAAAAVFATLVLARIPPRVLAIGFAAPLTFIVIGAVGVAVQVGAASADVWWRFGPASISEQSVGNAVNVLGRSAAGTLSVLLLATTTPMADLLGWARRRGLPGPLVEIASLMYRILFVLLDVALAMRAAQVARLGDDPAGKNRLARRWETAANTMGTLLVRAWTRAARLTEGLEARGIDGDLLLLARRTSLSRGFLLGSLGLVGGIWLVVAASQVVS